MPSASGQLVLTQSGEPRSLSASAPAGAVLTIAYTINTAMVPGQSLTISVEGVHSGARTVVDSFAGLASTTRTVTLADSFDSFVLMAYWSAGESARWPLAWQMLQGNLSPVPIGVSPGSVNRSGSQPVIAATLTVSW